MEGTCLCKAIKVKVDDPDLFTKRRGHICHCHNCRKTAGSAFGSNLIIETEKVTITGEENLQVYHDYETLSGNPVNRYFCRTCGNPIKSMTDLYKGKTILKLGIFERIPHPEWESFALKRQDWHKPFEGCTQYKIKSLGEKMDD
ncbi:Mss4-like protein [Halenospora varia]|nr:Mss4-like protein [Halenospora varia]